MGRYTESRTPERGGSPAADDVMAFAIHRQPVAAASRTVRFADMVSDQLPSDAVVTLGSP